MEIWSDDTNPSQTDRQGKIGLLKLLRSRSGAPLTQYVGTRRVSSNLFVNFFSFTLLESLWFSVLLIYSFQQTHGQQLGRQRHFKLKVLHICLLDLLCLVCDCWKLWKSIFWSLFGGIARSSGEKWPVSMRGVPDSITNAPNPSIYPQPSSPLW